MKLLVALLLALPLMAQAPITMHPVAGPDGVRQVPDYYEVLGFSDLPIRAVWRPLQDFPPPSAYSQSTWTASSQEEALQQIVELAEGGRLAASYFAGQIPRERWPHQHFAQLWIKISAETKESGQSLFTAQERWAHEFWDWWASQAKSRTGIDFDGDNIVYGDAPAVTHWRSDLTQRVLSWRKADQAVRQGQPIPRGTLLASEMTARHEQLVRDGVM